MIEEKRKLNWFRIFISTLILCAVMALMLWLYATKGQNVLSALEEKGGMTNLLWVVKHLLYIVPVIVSAIVLTNLYYLDGWEREGVSKKEKGIAVVLVTLFTYGIMLPIIISMSKTPAPLPDIELEVLPNAAPTLIELTQGWFFVQIIPFILWALYMFVRNESELKELEAQDFNKEETK